MQKTSDSYHHGDLKAAMIRAALDLVREKGPRGFTLNEASRVAGVSKSAPYRHFRDKTALLAEITVLGSRLLETELRAASLRGVTPREKLLAVVLGYIQFAQNHPDYFAVMFQSGIEKSGFPEIQEAATAAYSVAVELAHEVEPLPASATALALATWVMAHGFAMLMSEGEPIRAADAQLTLQTARELATQFLLPGDLASGRET